jgi:4-hydroxybenzoate polyprenyltransferase
MSKIRLFLEMIKFEHTIFALPYAYIGMILASYYTTGKMPGWMTVFWITCAMVGARSAAMALNRLIDRTIDAKNPRTANRELPRGLISIKETTVFIILSFLLLGISAWMLNPLCFYLMPVAVVVLVIYPYCKRFTWLCHLVLGIADALAPLGAWIAVTGRFDLPGIVLAAAVAVWIAGFDIIYACMDVDFDRKEGIYSIPAAFGIKNGLHISRFLHIATVFLFAILPFFLKLGTVYEIGVAIVALLLIIEHRLVSPKDMSKINTAFFTVNSVIASVAFLFTLTDISIHLW